MKHICIVSPDIVGPVTNGGIGTHCYTLALHCAQQGNTVTLLYTGGCSCAAKEATKALYTVHNVQVLFLDECPQVPYIWHLPEPLCKAARVFYTLRDASFAQIHFQDWQANGFYCIQAKRVLGYFSHTLLCVTSHSSTEWIQEGMQQWSTQQLADTKLMWAERYCVEHCDCHISPSIAMVQWLRENDWAIAAHSLIAPYIFHAGETVGYIPQRGVFAFFGRLETRKGLELFCEAVSQLPAQLRAELQQILFIGKEGTCAGQSAVDYIHTKLAPMRDILEIHCTLDTFAAQQLLRQRKALVFLPSLMDNLPFCGIECAVGNMPVLASTVGGFPEIFASEQLFVPTPQDLARSMELCLTKAWLQPEPVYSPHRALQAWDAIMALSADAAQRPCSQQPLVSVCMPYYNHGAYLQAALQSLCAQDYSNFEVIVMNDGSTEPASKEIFASLRQSMDQRFRFITKNNEGPAKTRNSSVSHAKGKYLVFCDADNIFEPHMLSTYVAAMEHCKLDILTCHFTLFSTSTTSIPVTNADCYAPLGADVTSAIVENVLGDTNFILKKTLFCALGGFTETRHGYEDWDFLLRAVLAGKTVDVVPLPLFHYRRTKGGVSTCTSPSGSHRMVLENFKVHLPSYAYRALRDLLAPAKNATGLAGFENSVIVQAFVRFGIGLETLYGKLCPAGSFLQRSATRLRHVLTTLFSGRRL